MKIQNRTGVIHNNGSFVEELHQYNSQAEFITEAFFLGVISLVGTVGNLLTFIATFKSRNLQSALHMIQRFSMVVDLYLCAGVLPYYICARHLYPLNIPDWLSNILVGNGLLMLALALNMHVLFAVNRMCGCFPNKNICRKLSSKKAVWISICLFLCYDAIVLSPVYIGYIKPGRPPMLGRAFTNGRNPTHVLKAYLGSLTLLTIVANLIATALLYFIIMYKLYKVSQRSRSRTFIRTTKILFILYLMYLACWLPAGVLWFVDPGNKRPAWVSRLIQIVKYLYSALNPLYYIWRIPGYKEAVLRMLGITPNRITPVVNVARVPVGGPRQAEIVPDLRQNRNDHQGNTSTRMTPVASVAGRTQKLNLTIMTNRNNDMLGNSSTRMAPIVNVAAKEDIPEGADISPDPRQNRNDYAVTHV